MGRSRILFSANLSPSDFQACLCKFQGKHDECVWSIQIVCLISLSRESFPFFIPSPPPPPLFFHNLVNGSRFALFPHCPMVWTRYTLFVFDSFLGEYNICLVGFTKYYHWIILALFLYVTFSLSDSPDNRLHDMNALNSSMVLHISRVGNSKWWSHL